MGDVKFNLQQVFTTPPRLWVRFQNAVMFVCTGGIGILATTSLFAPKTINLVIFFIAIFMLLIQGVGVFLGVDPKAGSPTTIENATEIGQKGSATTINTTTTTKPEP